jgi:Xaa-Pro aminopeptidase
MFKSYFPLEEYESRWQRVHAQMTRRGFAAAVVWSRSSQSYDRSADVLYLVNFYAPETAPDTKAWRAWGYYAVLLVPGEVPELICDPADERNAHIATDRILRCQNPVQGVAQRLRERGITGEVGLVGAKVLAWTYGRELEQATPGIVWRECDELVLLPRRIKSPRELDCMREGGHNASAALDIMMKALVVGRSEREAVAEAVGTLYRAGSTGAFISANHGDSIGHWCRDPLLGRSADAPKPGDFVRGWMDSVYQGYWFDPGRTAVAGGRPNAAQQALIDDLIRIIEAVMAAIRPGARTLAIAAEADALIARAGGDVGGLGAVFPCVAHGIGLHWEPPYIGTTVAEEHDVIAENMVMGVEYFLSREGVGTVGIEENFIVGPDCNESITYLPMQGW